MLSDAFVGMLIFYYQYLIILLNSNININQREFGTGSNSLHLFKKMRLKKVFFLTFRKTREADDFHNYGGF